MNEYIKSDLYRYTGKTGIKDFIKCYFTVMSFRVQVAHRLVNSTGLEKIWGGFYGG